MTDLRTSGEVPGSWDPIWPSYAHTASTLKSVSEGHETSTAKIWSVYVSEAHNYDAAQVESWRSDMDGMLIFAGLFSAILTAFIIESYKTLNADSGDTTIVLLRQISQQLAATANGSLFSMPLEPDAFVPPVSSLVCNALWFISLGLSLSCVLIATLLEQWARDFLHRADMRSAPVIRARIFSFLYYGLKRFNMHLVVEIIPNARLPHPLLCRPGRVPDASEQHHNGYFSLAFGARHRRPLRPHHPPSLLPRLRLSNSTFWGMLASPPVISCTLS
ncbi:hypothetical protein FB451DRAFT_1558683 [Mycena latifolia]|nr:hypothetical protein FB451DRAFT_1558683 [Mycena latifolia]